MFGNKEKEERIDQTRYTVEAHKPKLVFKAASINFYLTVYTQGIGDIKPLVC